MTGQRIGAKGPGLWLGNDGVWRFEDTATYVCSRSSQVPVRLETRSRLELEALLSPVLGHWIALPADITSAKSISIGPIVWNFS
jgi:hypothetical protein